MSGKITELWVMAAIDHLLIVARSYADACGIDLSTASWRATGDTKKLPAMEVGADIQMRRFERTMQWFSDHWPADLPWPENIHRPSLTEPERAA